jgi:hypothetical protein
VTEASQLGFWSVGQVFSRYRNYEGEKDRPLTEQEHRHLNGLMDEATIVVDKFIDSDPEQARWYARIREAHEGTQVSVVATPWDQALANRVPLDLGAVAEETLNAKLAMADVVLRGVDRANRRRLGLPEDDAAATGHGHPEPPRPAEPSEPPEPPRWYSQPAPPAVMATHPDLPGDDATPADLPSADLPSADLPASVPSAGGPPGRAFWPFRGPEQG